MKAAPFLARMTAIFLLATALFFWNNGVDRLNVALMSSAWVVVITEWLMLALVVVTHRRRARMGGFGRD